MAIFEVSSFDQIFKVFLDKEHVETAIPDEKFLDRSKNQGFPSTLVLVFDDPS